MSTRAIIAYKTDSKWTGVWNHWEGHPQYLGAAIIKRIAVLDGNLRQFARQFIDRCPEGWSDFAKGERTDEGGGWSGTCKDGLLTFDKVPDAHYLYLLDIASRRLEVYPVRRGAVEPFDVVVFDETGAASPAQFVSVPQ
jgi:hypothetical protein